MRYVKRNKSRGEPSLRYRGGGNSFPERRTAIPRFARDDKPKKEKAPRFHMEPLFMSATTYSPTHLRVQYNRPCRA